MIFEERCLVLIRSSKSLKHSFLGYWCHIKKSTEWFKIKIYTCQSSKSSTDVNTQVFGLLLIWQQRWVHIPLLAYVYHVIQIIYWKDYPSLGNLVKSQFMTVIVFWTLVHHMLILSWHALSELWKLCIAFWSQEVYVFQLSFPRLFWLLGSLAFLSDLRVKATSL